MQAFRYSLRLLLAAVLIAAWPALVGAGEAGASSPPDFTLGLGTPQRAAAERALPSLAERARGNGNRRLSDRIFPVDSADALRDAVIGYGFEVYLIDAALLLAGNDIDKSLRHTGVWRFIVMLGDRSIGLVTVARVQGQWKAVQVGGAGLAADISSAIRGYVGHPSAPQLRFIRSEQGMADFIEVVARGTGSAQAEPAYIPLLSAQELASPSSSDSTASAVDASKREALSEHRIVDALRASVQRGLTDPRASHRGIAP